MREVLSKDKGANNLRVNGKWIRFVNGKATVSEDDAKAIRDMGNSDYQIVAKEKKKKSTPKPKEVKEAPKKATPKATSKKAKK